MGLFPSIISVIFSAGFLILLLLFAWYVALPIIFLFLIFGLFNFFRGKPVFGNVPQYVRTFSYPRQQKTSSTKKNEKIIDVEYTEVP